MFVLRMCNNVNSPAPFVMLASSVSGTVEETFFPQWLNIERFWINKFLTKIFDLGGSNRTLKINNKFLFKLWSLFLSKWLLARLEVKMYVKNVNFFFDYSTYTEHVPHRRIYSSKYRLIIRMNKKCFNLCLIEFSLT